MYDQVIERVDCFKYLGVFLDEFLNWSVHLSWLNKKISARLGMLRRIRRNIDTKTCALMYNSLIQPLFDYCDIIWDGANKTDTDRLQSLHHRAARIVLNDFSRNGYQFVKAGPQLLTALGWDTIESRRRGHVCHMMFKCIKSYQGDIVPPYLETIFDCYKSTHQYQTRNSHRFSLPGYRTTTACNSFIYRAIKYYNNLPAVFHDIYSLRVFKQMLKNHSM